MTYLYEVETDPTKLELRREELHTILEGHTCKVKFTKVDGTERVMICTLRPEVIPVTEHLKTSPNTLSVWCLDNTQWRSFRVANIQEVQVIA